MSRIRGINAVHFLVASCTTAAIISAAWIAMARSTSPYFPDPSKIVDSFEANWLSSGGRVQSDLIPSLRRVFIGFTLASVIGVAGGYLLGQSRRLRLVFDPLVTFVRATPPPVLVPLFIAVLGFGESTKIVIITLVCVWPILLNTVDGIMGVDPTMTETARAFHIRGWRMALNVVLPAASPRIFSGLRISLALSVLILVVSEMLGSTNGLGFFIQNSQQTFSIPEMWSGTILLGIVGVVLNSVFVAVERRVLAWHYASNQASS